MNKLLNDPDLKYVLNTIRDEKKSNNNLIHWESDIQ
jgi:hypothetical protein